MRRLPVKVLTLLNLALVLAGPAVQAQTVESPSLGELRFYFQHLAALDAAADKADAEGTPGADTDGWRRYEQNAAGLNDHEAAILKDVAYRCNQAIRNRESAPQPRPGATEILSAAVEELRTHLAPETFESVARRIEDLIRPGIVEVPAARASGAEEDELEPQAVAEVVQVLSLTGKFQDGFFMAECATARQGQNTDEKYIAGVSYCSLYGTGLSPIPLSCSGPDGVCMVYFPPALPGQRRWTQATHFLQMYHSDNCLGTGAPGLQDPLHYCGRNPLPSIVDMGDIPPLGGLPACWGGYPQTDLCPLAVSKASPITYLDISPRQATVPAGGELQLATPNNMLARWFLSGPGAIDDFGLYKAPASVGSQQTATITACDAEAPGYCVNATITLSSLKVEVVSQDFEVLPGSETELTATVIPAAQGQELEWTISPAVGTLTASDNSATYEAPKDDDLPGAFEITVKACLKPTGTVCGTARLLVPKIHIFLIADPPTHTLPACGATIHFTAVVSGSNVPRRLQWESYPEYAGASLTVDTPDTMVATYKPPALERAMVRIRACLGNTVEDFCSEDYSLDIVDPVRIDSVTGDWTAGQLDSSFTITGSGFGTLPKVTVNGLEAKVLSASDSLITGVFTLPIAMGGTPVNIVVKPSICLPASFPSLGQTSPTIAPVSRLEVSPAAAEVRQGGSQPFSAICLTARETLCNSPDAALVQWTASKGTIDPVGLSVQYRAPASVPASTPATVTACWSNNTLCAPSALVTLLPPIAVSVSPKTATVSAGQTQQLTATVTNTTNTAVTWSLEPPTPEAGGITQSGLYTAPPALGGVTTVTVIATSQADATRKDTATVTLMAPCAPQSKDFEVLAGRCTVVGADHEIIVTSGYSFDVRIALQPKDGSAVDSRCFRFEWTSSLDPTRPVDGQSFRVDGKDMTLELKVTSLDNAHSDSIKLTVKTDPSAYNSCVKRRAVRSSGGSSSGGSSAYSTLIQLGESVTLSPPEGINGSSFDWYKVDPNATDVVFSHDATVTVSPAVDTRYWLVYRYTDGNGVFHEEQSENHYVLIKRPVAPRVHIEPRFQVIPATTGPVMEVIDAAVTDGNYEGYTFEWNVGSDNTRPSTPLPWPYRRLVLDRAYDNSFWCKVTDRNGNVMITDVATVAVTCSDGLRGSIGVSPGNHLGRTDRPVVTTNAGGLRLRYNWFERLPEETTPRPYSASGAAISPTPAHPLTYYSAKIEDACGQTAVLPETRVYLCLPTIDSQPVDQVVPRGGSTSLTVAASPAIAGQPLMMTWRSGETGQAVGSGPMLNVTPEPGTTQTFYAEVSADCSGTPRSVQTRAATVSGCALAATASSDRNIALGQTATLSASVSGTLASATELEYTWYYGPAPGTEYASGPGLWSITTAPQTTTTYWVRVKDGTCTADSSPLTVSVCKPTLTAQPQGTTVNSGQTATLSATATGAPLSYQWYIGAAGNTAQPIPGATSSTYTTPPMSATTSYWVRVTGCTTTDSVAATVNVCAPPAITSGPTADSQRIPGTIGKMTVTTTGTGLNYQWFTGQSGDTTVPVAGSGCNTAQCSFTLSSSKYYWVRIIGTCGTLNSPAVLHPVSPTIVQQPQSASVPPNATPTLSVAATGTNLTYQWYRGSTGNTATPMSGATAATFTVPPVTAPVSYWCRVTSAGNPTAIADSAEAALSFCSGPSIYGPLTQYLGYNQWRLGINVEEQDLGNVDCAWYIGVPGNVSQSVFQYEGGTYTNVTATSAQTWWCRAWYSDHSCYTDTGGAMIYKVQ